MSFKRTRHISIAQAENKRAEWDGEWGVGVGWGVSHGVTHLKAMWTSKVHQLRSDWRLMSICPASVNTPWTQNWEFSFILHGSSPIKLEAEFNRNSYCAHLPSNVVQVDVTCWQLSQSFKRYTQNGRLQWYTRVWKGRLKYYTSLRLHHELYPE